jgi:hypothetical protein
MKAGKATSSRIDLSQHFDFTLAGKYTVSPKGPVWTKDGASRTLKTKSNKLEITVGESLRRGAAGAGPRVGKAAEATWGSEVEGQAVSIATAKTAYDTGEPIELRVCFKNVRKQT